MHRERRIRLHENGNITITGYAYTDTEDQNNLDDNARPEKVAAGKTTKSFYINNRHYRAVSSSAVKLWQKKQNAIIFVTLTFPQDIDEGNANICFSKFVENLKVTYKLRQYIAVKELTEAGRPHFHCLFDLPFTDVYRLNRAWTKTFSEFMPGSVNALRLGSPQHGTVVKDINRCVKYLTKYMTKIKDSDRNKYKSRCIFMSRDLKSCPVDIEEADLRQLVDRFHWRKLQYEYCTIVLLKDIFRNIGEILTYFDEIRQKTISYQQYPP